jgi:hypothetical protein
MTLEQFRKIGWPQTTYAHITGETVPCQPGEGAKGPRPVLTLLNLAGSSASLYLHKKSQDTAQHKLGNTLSRNVLGRIYGRRDVDELNHSLIQRFALKQK